jgi:hypothetical protein
MATQAQLLAAWTARKTGRRHFYQLRESRLQEFEYKGRQMGHPSNYAAVRFQCDPQDELAFRSVAHWPTDHSPAYCADLEQAIGEGIIDGLLGQFVPYRGCLLTLLDVGWHTVSSSEAAFYRATVEAMRQLISEGAWVLTDGVPTG